MQIVYIVTVIVVGGLAWISPGLADQVADSRYRATNVTCAAADAAQWFPHPILPGGVRFPIELASGDVSDVEVLGHDAPSVGGDGDVAAELRAVLSELSEKIDELSKLMGDGAEDQAGSRSSRRTLAEATRETGDDYRHGRYRRKDVMKALAHYLRALKYGDIQAFNRIGALYLSGELGIVDSVRAREFFLDGVEKGDARSAHWLGRMHLEGQGAKKDLQLARGWWVVATALGDWQALEDLMRLYLRCMIVVKDWRVRGLSWALLAFADERFRDAEIARLIAGRERLTPFVIDEIRSARRMASAFEETYPGWRHRAAPRHPGYGEGPRYLQSPARQY